jgi:cytochrome P450
MLGLLMEARDRQRRAMPDSQLVREIMTLIFAGHETTASTLNWTWYLLSKSAEVGEKLSSELNAVPGNGSPEIGDLAKFVYTRQVIEEMLGLSGRLADDARGAKERSARGLSRSRRNGNLHSAILDPATPRIDSIPIASAPMNCAPGIR